MLKNEHPCPPPQKQYGSDLKAKVYFSFNAYARDTDFCNRAYFVAHANWSYSAVIMFSHMVATLSLAVVSQ